MDENIELWLHDMLAATDEIFSFLPEPRNYLVFAQDIKTQRAVERNIEIIGEAMNRILKTDPEFKIAMPAVLLTPATGSFMAMTQFQATSSGPLQSKSCRSCERRSQSCSRKTSGEQPAHSGG